MKDEILASIGKLYLGFITMETRHSDAKDMHVVAVWQAKAALELAYKAGAESATFHCPNCAREFSAEDIVDLAEQETEAVRKFKESHTVPWR